MASQTVLLIGASGFIGRVVAQEFLSQKSRFARVAILTDASKAQKFNEISAMGMEVVVGSYLEPSSFLGKSSSLPFQANLTRCEPIGVTTVICMLGHHVLA